MEIPKWATNVAIITLIFSIGGYITRLEYGIKDINERIGKLEKSVVAVETAISIHHGQNWSEKIENKTLKKVDDLETKIGDISKDYTSSVHSMEDMQAREKAFHLWTQQGDELIREMRLARIRSLAEYRSARTGNEMLIYINKAHRRSSTFKLGDRVILQNTQPPSLEVEVTVGGYLDYPDKQNILLQINEKLIDSLGLRKELGHFELFVQGKPEALRWKTVDDFYKIIKNQ